ncbi:NACHT domain-containing protein [Microcoleus vaginatus PCC 9802]|uniref:HEAT repeat domain-containing protein n=1 Tax=Microcoleus vaginatus TaxID=119532 RepID=UPI001F61AC55|nr:NACHT domain-containing protein [Microcoleus vaginatus PCC 9802]
MGKPTGLGKVAQATMNFIQKVAMARKYGKNATTKNNVFKLVEALLALADEEIAVPGDKLKATFNVEWVKEDELLVSGKFQQKRNKQTKIVEGITKEDLWTLVECFGKALELSQPKDEKNVDNAQRRGEAIQDVLDCLKDLGILILEPSARNQGFWKFSLKLDHQTKPKKNLEVIEKQWQEKIGSVTVEKTENSGGAKNSLNWQEICRQNLAQQKQLTTNLFTNANGMTPQLDGVYVPLAIVERQKPKPQPRNQEEEKEKETEKLIPIAEERFFEDVLRQGKSDISQGRKIAIIGEPGAGKTTRLQKIADWILEQELGLPIWIDLAELGEQDICQYLEKAWLLRCRGEVTRGDLEPQISLVWLLLDGVDEMTHTQGMQQLGKDLLRTWVQAARVVVTCRVNVWEADKNAFSGFDVFRNLEFNAEQVTEYIRRWFAGMGDAATGESLELALAESENSRLKELIQNPLRLWMLCQIWSSRKGTLPDTQAKLYASFIKYIYRWKEQFIKSYAKLCGKTQSQCQKLLHEALGELAKAAIDGKAGRFRLSYQLVSEYLGERSDETSLLSLALSLGWLNRVGIDFDEPEESVYAFYHATFQEYFAAFAVDDWDYFLPRNHVDFPVVGKEYRIFEAQWKQVILLWLGLEEVNRNQKEEFIEALGGFEDGCSDFYEYRVDLLAAAGIGEFKDCKWAAEIVATIIKWGCGYFNLEKQEWWTFLDPIAEGARAALLQTNYSIAVNQLIDLLKRTKDENARRSVAECLGKIDPGNPEAITALIAILSTTTDEDTRWRVADILGKIDPGNPEAIAALIAILSTTTDKNCRQSVAECLGKVATGNIEAIAALIAILSTTTDWHTRWSVANILGKIATGNPEAIAALIAILSTTTDWKTRPRVADILGNIDPGNTEAIAALIAILSTTTDEDTRRSVAYSLGEIATGNSEAIAALIAILSTTTDEDTRRSVAECLGEIATGNSEAIAALIELLSTTTDWHTRWSVANILGKIATGNPEAIAALIAILSTTTDEDTRRSVANILGEIATGNPEAIAALIAILSTTTDEDTRRSVANILGEIATGNPEAIAALIAILSTTTDEDTRRRVAYSLGKIDPGNPEAIAALIAILSTTTDEDTRREVADILGKIATGNPEAIAALMAILSTTTDEDTRRRVAYSLGKIDPGNPEAIAALIIAILSTTNDDYTTRPMFADCLGKIDPGNPEAIAALIAILSTTTDEGTRWIVAYSLGEIDPGNPEAIAALIAILSTTNDELTRGRYAGILGKIATGNPEAIAALIELLSTTNDEHTRWEVAESLNKIVQNDQMPSVVSALQQFQCDQTYETNFDLYKYSFEIIWNCAQNLPYPTFYQAWHHQLTTPHPEVPETTGVGSTPFTQSLNLADLPNILDARLADTQLIESVQLICIDTSKFIDTDNPALEIYEQFLDQNCPERPQRRTRNPPPTQILLESTPPPQRQTPHPHLLPRPHIPRRRRF